MAGESVYLRNRKQYKVEHANKVLSDLLVWKSIEDLFSGNRGCEYLRLTRKEPAGKKAYDLLIPPDLTSF